MKAKKIKIEIKDNNKNKVKSKSKDNNKLKNKIKSSVKIDNKNKTNTKIKSNNKLKNKKKTKSGAKTKIINRVRINNKKGRSPAKIKVVGIGGAGGNAVSRMYDNFPRSVDLIAINTDIQDLEYAKVKRRVHIGRNLTKGLGTGMNPDLGRQAAEEDREEIAEILKGADIVFITAGFGGGTGSGAGPVVAEVAKELGILTVAIITKPFSFEGSKRSQVAYEGLARIRDRVDTLITIPNDKIFSIINKDTPLTKAFKEIDEVLKNSVLGITELITSPGIVNVDFADVKAIMNEAGSAVIGIGVASGQDRAIKAVNLAINSPLLETTIDCAKGVLFSISGNRDLKMNEVNEIAKMISENVDQSAKIIFGTYYDKRINKGQIKVTLIATGFNGSLSDKDGVLMSDFFSPGSIMENKTEFEKIREETEEDSLNPKLFSEETEKKESKNNNQSEETLDTPTFLRRKKKR
ncbi:cell division protein FtsZ [Candidatus Wolfebacteria bacterium]|nr:cell division protein FtsZ [Candidatus Wolfebacteria bacterium]